MEVSENNQKEVCSLSWSGRGWELRAANPGFASGTELSNIKILTDGGEHMEGCYLHNPAALPSRAEPGEAPARPYACLARGAVAPRNNLPFCNPTWLFEG